LPQTFDDLDAVIDEKDTPTLTNQENSFDGRHNKQPSLLAMIYEFERGHGAIDMFSIGDAYKGETVNIGKDLDFLGDLEDIEH
jgi:hypothetical protein